jgi:excisionase family DNA binding protein
MLETTKTENKIAFGLAELAELTSISVAMLHKEIRAGRLPVKRCGRRVLILKSDFLDYLNSEETAEVKTN